MWDNTGNTRASDTSRDGFDGYLSDAGTFAGIALVVALWAGAMWVMLS